MSMTREEAIKALKYVKMCIGEEGPITQAIDVATAGLRPVSREQVEKGWRGYWIHDEIASDKSIEGKFFLPLCNCSRCGGYVQQEASFCPHCGAPMTDEAVQTLLKRLEALKDD